MAWGIYMANVPVSSLGWKKVSYSTLKSVWFRNGSLHQRWAATCGGWHLAFSGGKRRLEGKEYQEKEEAELTWELNVNLNLTHAGFFFFKQVKSTSCFSSTSYPPPYCCACVSRRIRRQHGGGGAKGLILLAPPPPCCNMMRRLQPLKRTLNKYTIKYSAYIYFIYIFKEQHI